MVTNILSGVSELPAEFKRCVLYSTILDVVRSFSSGSATLAGKPSHTAFVFVV